MKSAVAFSYAQARLQAWHGRRPDDNHWRRLDACDTTHAYLQAAGTGSLARWVRGLRARDDPHALEASLNERWQDYVEQVAAWSPPQWRSAVACCGELRGLPAAADRGDSEALAAWRGDWHRLMPEIAPADAAGLAELERHVDRFLVENGRADGATPARSAELRDRLEQRAVSLFRRHAGRPAALFAHLLLAALDLQRLRGGLLRRRLLTPEPQRSAA